MARTSGELNRAIVFRLAIELMLDNNSRLIATRKCRFGLATGRTNMCMRACTTRRLVVDFVFERIADRLHGERILMRKPWMGKWRMLEDLAAQA